MNFKELGSISLKLKFFVVVMTRGCKLALWVKILSAGLTPRLRNAGAVSAFWPVMKLPFAKITTKISAQVMSLFCVLSEGQRFLNSSLTRLLLAVITINELIAGFSVTASVVP